MATATKPVPHTSKPPEAVTPNAVPECRNAASPAQASRWDMVGLVIWLGGAMILVALHLFDLFLWIFGLK